MHLLLSRTFIYSWVFLFVLTARTLSQDVLRILPLGNSITVGYTDGILPVSNQTSYRFGLYYQLLNAGYDFDFVGSEISGWSYFSDCQHGAINGFRDQYLVRLLQDGFDMKRNQQLVNPPGPYLDVYDPDIILLHIGTNDVTHEGDPGTYQVELVLDLIDEYEAREGKEVTVFLGLIINRMIGSTGRTETTNYNNQLQTMAEARIAAGDNIVIVDLENGAGLLYTSADMTDWLHPNSVGYNKMAIAWSNHIKDYFNRVPVIEPPIPDQEITQGGLFTTINLDNYVSDMETPDNRIKWTYYPLSPQNLNVSINANRQLSVTVKSGNWYGNEEIILTAEDEGIDGVNKRSVSQPVRYTVNQIVNQPPEINPPIPDQVKPEGSSFEVIDLDFHVSDVETADEAITWTVTPLPANFNVAIDADHLATIVPKNANWNGSETITFKATDDGVGGLYVQYDTDQATFTVTPVNDPPVFTSVPITTATEGYVYSYTVQATDIEGQVVSYYSKELPGWLNFNAGSRILSGIPMNEHVGQNSVTISATDGSLETDHTFIIQVQNVNNAPVIVGMTRQIKTSKNTPVGIRLEDLLVEDPDNIYPDDFTLSLEPGNNYTISGNIIYPDTDFMGILVVPLKVSDGLAFSPISNVNVQVVLYTAVESDELSNRIEVYPNPTSGVIRFRIPDAEELMIEIFDLTGSSMYTGSFHHPAGMVSVDLKEHGATPGAYIYQVRSGDEVATGIVILE